MFTRVQALLAAAVVAGGTGLATAPAAGALTPPDTRTFAPVTPQTIHTQNRVDDLTLATGSGGEIVATWSNGTNNGETGHVAVRPVGGWFGPAQLINYGYSSDLAPVGGGPAGTMPLIVQQRLGLSGFRLFDGTSFGVRRDLLFGYTEGTQAARCPDGSLVVVSRPTVTSPVSQSVQGNRYDRALIGLGGTYSLSPTVSRRYRYALVSCDNSDLPLFASVDPASPDRLRVGPIGGALIVDRTAPAGYSITRPIARVLPDGRVWVLWAEYPASGSPAIYAATRAPGASGAAGPAVDISGGGDTGLAGASVDGAGRLQVLIARQAIPGMGAPVSYELRTAQAGSASLGAAVEIVGSGLHGASLLDSNPDGAPRLLVETNSPRSVELRGIPQAGSTDPATALPGTGDETPTTFAWSPGGDLFTGVAVERAPNVVDVRIGGLDSGAPPTLDAISVPAVAVAGAALPVSVVAADGFGVAKVAWSVDGAEVATGQSASPVVASPGTKSVTVTATDFAGHATSATRTVRVVDPEPQSPPVQPVPPPAPPATVDRKAPTVRASAKRASRGKASRYAAVSVRVGERSDLRLELIGTLRRGKQRGTLILRSARIRSLAAGRTRSVKLTIPASLAKLVHRGVLKVRVIATDAAGNARTVTVTVKRAKSRKPAPKRKRSK